MLPFLDPNGRKHMVKQSEILAAHFLHPVLFIPFINIFPPW